MEYRRLGRTNLNISRIAYGGLALFFVPPDTAIQLLNTAIDKGINYVDCDEAGNQFFPGVVYEDTRAKLGQVLKTRRKEVFVGIKCMFASYDEVARDIDRALEMVVKGTSREVIDIFHLAHIDVDEKLDKILAERGGLAAAEKAKQEGKIGHILVASHNPRVLIRALKTGRFDVAEFPFTIIEQEYLQEIIPYCREHDIGSIIMKPLGGGQLGACAELSLRWITQHDVDVIIPGMKSLDELERNTVAVEGAIPLSEAERAELNRIALPVGRMYCHRCGYCLPCPQGIHTISQIDMFRSNLLSLEKKKERYRQYRARGNPCAADCIGCGQCVEKCPFKLPVPEIMQEIHRVLGDDT